jgi:hypothetical protein
MDMQALLDPPSASGAKSASDSGSAALCRKAGGPCRSDSDTVLHKPLVAIPVLLDGSPDWEHRLHGVTRSFTHEGLDLELNASVDLPSRALVLVLASADGRSPCLGVEVCATHRGDVDGPVEVEARFGGLADTVLRPENLVPRFHSELLEFSLGLPEDLLRKWAAIGVLQPYLLDRVQLCPQCYGLPTFRRGCANCGSVQVSQDQFLHHFACAHVGLIRDFETQGELVCPKCRTRRLIPGVDYEFLPSPFECRECHWSDTQLELAGQCLRCELRFPAHQAYEMELRGYHAHRMDPLVFLPQS